MDATHLETLMAVLDEGTFDAAARRLHVTPSAVSQRIKAMEQDAGRVLVQRTNPARPTEAGEVVARYAKQARLLSDELDRGLGEAGSIPTLSVAVNADSLATWILPALARVQLDNGVVFDVHREDQALTAQLLRSGTVVAAVTSDQHPVQGCSSTALGSMTYRAVATPGFVERWLSEGLAGLAGAPVVLFDRNDELQDDFLRRHGGGVPPRAFVPTSADFARAVTLGMGWGMLPDLQSEPHLRDGSLVELAPGERADVRLYWQRWNLASPLLDALTAAVQDAARPALSRG